MTSAAFGIGAVAFVAAALLAGAWFVARTANLRVVTVAFALVVAAGVVPLATGRTTTWAFAALAAATYFADRRRVAPTVAALIALGCVDLASALAATAAWTFALRPPRAARTLALAATAVGASAAAAVGAPAPLAWPSAALALGALACGTIVAYRVRAALGGDAFLIAVPPATLLVAGSAFDEARLVAAVPAAFLLATRATLWRPVAWLALVILACPWDAFATATYATFVPAFGTALVAVALLGFTAASALSTFARVIVAAGAVAGCAALALALRHLPGAMPVAPAARALDARQSSAAQARKLPGALAIAALVALAAAQRSARGRRTSTATWPPPGVADERPRASET